MKQLSKVSLLLALTATLALSSCKGTENKPDVPPTPKPTKTIEYLNATSHTDVVYYSLKEGKEVKPADPTKDLSWDIAFNRARLTVNAPEHYSGKGGIARTAIQDLDKVKDTKGLTFVGNTARKGEKVGGMGPNSEDTIDRYYAFEIIKDGKKARNKYTAFDIDKSKMMQGAAAMYSPVKDVYVVRAADGKTHYAILFTGAVNAEGHNGGTLSFKYREL